MVILREDGDRLRGFSHDFYPGKPRFHFHEMAASGDIVETRELDLEEIHAIFFVRDFGFDRDRRYTADDAPAFPDSPPPAGARRLRVTCVWGEVMEGVTYEYEPGRAGFFLFPTAPEDRVHNLERAFLTAGAIAAVDLPAA